MDNARIKKALVKRSLWTYFIIISILLSFFLVPVCSYWFIHYYSKNLIYSDIKLLPPAKVALVLGTSKRLSDGSLNDFFFNRIIASAKLYNEGKVKKILVSGDNKTEYYNEPLYMKKSLINEGVKANDIILDYAGFRTFDSVIRAKLVFQQEKFIIVSQKFHLERALFITQSKNIEAYGFIAGSSSDKSSNLRQHFRESFARLLSILDCYVLNTQPKFLGEKQSIDGEVN